MGKLCSKQNGTSYQAVDTLKYVFYKLDSSRLHQFLTKKTCLNSGFFLFETC